MKHTSVVALAVALAFLAGCTGSPGTQSSSLGSLPSVATAAKVAPPAASLTELANYSYSDGSITVFSIANGRATKTKSFVPAHRHGQDIAMDKTGRIYTAVTDPGSKKCSACVEVFTDTGSLVEQLDAPILSGAPGAPMLVGIAVDDRSNVYVADSGQQAVYFFPHARKTKSPTIVVQNSEDSASVVVAPNGATVVLSGGCGFASVRPYTRTASGQYTPGACFGIGNIALIGGATDNPVDVMTPVDGAPGLVSVSSPTGGGNDFRTPGRIPSIDSVAFNRDASVAYVANHEKECVYAYARPANGWLSGQPTLLATYKGFSKLNVIAVPQ